MIVLKREEMNCLSPLWAGKKECTLQSAIEGKMGRGWVDDKTNPTSGIIVVADFCYMLGRISDKVDITSLRDILNHCKRKIIVTEEPSWIALIQRYYPDSFKSFKRYATKKDPSVFNRDVLKAYISAVEGDYKIDRIDEKLYDRVLADPFMADCCCFFPSLEDFLKNGIGYMIEENGEFVAGASSYSVCEGYIDITIGTKEAYRQKGLALAVASKVILESLERNIYPTWDAVDMRSISLAKKLGYEFDKEYEVYMF